MRPRTDPAVSSPPSDVALIRGAGAGDRGAFTTFVRRHAPAVLRLARALAPPTLAEDVVQQTFMNAFRAAPNFRGEASPKTWLLTIARNTAFRMRGNAARELAKEPALLELSGQAGWGGPNPESLALLAERKALVQRALTTLSPLDREILILRDLEQLSGIETAGLLKLSPAAMKSRLHRARLRLAAALRALDTEEGA